MEGMIFHTPQGDYVKCLPGSGIISSSQDVLDLLACFYGHEPVGLLVDTADLHPDFFDLKSGLLGEVFLKLSSYRVKTAFLVDFDNIKSERFQELIYEHRRSNEIKFFDELSEAEAWLFCT